MSSTQIVFTTNEEKFVVIWNENIHTFNAISCMTPNDFWKTFHFHSFFSKGNTGYLTPDTSCTMCKGGTIICTTCLIHCGSWVWKRGVLILKFIIMNYNSILMSKLFLSMYIFQLLSWCRFRLDSQIKIKALLCCGAKIWIKYYGDALKNGSNETSIK